MKKLITLLILLAVISGLSVAKTIKAPKVTEGGTATSLAVPSIQPTLNEFNTPKYPGDAPLLDAFIDTIPDATFSFYGYVTPVVYEPNSGTLIMVQNKRYRPEGAGLRGSAYIKTTQNNGLTWTKKVLFDEADQVPVWPSISVLNPTGKTNPAEFNYVITAPIAIKEGETYPWKGDVWIIADGDAGQVDPVVLDYPTPGQRWFWTRAAANVVSDYQVFYNVGTLSSQEGYQYGYYGSSAFNMTLGDFSAQESPAQWAPEKFKPSNGIGSSYNDYLYIDVDNAGGTYVAVKNMFVDDQDNRIPAVSKSEDGGTTWSEFDRMPVTLMRNYYTVFGGDADHSFIIPYSSDGFVVWGVDSWSFIFRVVISKGSDQYEFHIVEAFKKGGAWGIRKIADWSGFNQLVMNDVSRTAAYKDSIQVSRLGNELQIVRTADSKFVIAKWVDYIDSTLAVEPPVMINGGADTLKQIQSNDVFMAYRDVTKADWSETHNVTNNAFIDKCTYLPLIVPDLEHIPLFELYTFSSQYSDPNHPRNQYPPNAWSFITDAWQGVGFTNINLTGEVSVEEEDYNFSVNKVYPNPTSNAAEFTFNLDNSSNVVIDIYNSLGQKVGSVLNQFMSAGIHGVNIDVSNYVSGSYYIRMTSNGHSITKALSVFH
jgi:hypothetical protein